MTVARDRERRAPQVDQDVLDLEDLFEEHSVSSSTVASSLSIDHAVHTQHAFLRVPQQVANRLRGAQLLRALTDAFALPSGTRELTLQVIDLAQGWSDTVNAQFLLTDLLALVVSVYIYVKLHLAPGQVYLHTSL